MKTGGKTVSYLGCCNSTNRHQKSELHQTLSGNAIVSEGIIQSTSNDRCDRYRVLAKTLISTKHVFNDYTNTECKYYMRKGVHFSSHVCSKSLPVLLPIGDYIVVLLLS